jgi:hypothetical protein
VCLAKLVTNTQSHTECGNEFTQMKYCVTQRFHFWFQTFKEERKNEERYGFTVTSITENTTYKIMCIFTYTYSQNTTN